MTRHSIVFTGEARRDLREIHAFIADKAGVGVASDYLDRLQAFCRTLVLFPSRGTCRDDIRPGLRIIGFERRIAVAFVVRERDVVILRLLYAGRSMDRPDTT